MHWWLPEISPGEKILRSLIVYFFLLIMFRLLGKREVAQMTVFDLVVLLILSNVVQNAMIGPDNSVTGGLIGATSILIANWFVGRIAYGHPRFAHAVEGVPVLVVHDGQFVEPALRRESISTDELLSNLRSQGIFNLQDVRTAILEALRQAQRHEEQDSASAPPSPDQPRPDQPH